MKNDKGQALKHDPVLLEVSTGAVHSAMIVHASLCTPLHLELTVCTIEQLCSVKPNLAASCPTNLLFKREF